jgi:hypothetical protein
MEADTQTAQDAGVAKIRALLLAAKPGLVANARELATAFNQPLALGAKVPDRSPGIAAFKQKLGALRADVEGTAVQGAGGVSAKDLTLRALLETDQALRKLAESSLAPDQTSATILLAESVRLLKAAKATSLLAGKALNIPWPLA